MTVTISSVTGSQPEQVMAAAVHAGNSATTASQQVDAGKQNLDRLRSGWEGTASEAAIATAERTLVEQQKIADALGQLYSALSDGGSELSAIRTGVVDAVETLTQQGWQVAEDGTVSVRPGSPLDQLATLSPVTEMEVRQIAAISSVKLKTLLAQFDSADRALADGVRKATAGLGSPADHAGPPNRSDSPSPGEPKPKDGNTSAPAPGPGAKPSGPDSPPKPGSTVDSPAQTMPTGPSTPTGPGSAPSAPRTPAQPPSAPTSRPTTGTTPTPSSPVTPGRNAGAAPTRPASTNAGSAPVHANTQEPAARSEPPTGAGAPPVSKGGPASATAPMPATSAPTRFDAGNTAGGTASGANSGGERVLSAFDGGNLPDKHTYQYGDDGWPIHVWVDDGEEIEHDDWA
ncbi:MULTISPECIES: WXG100 family type VII secretion target [unclassified Mycolicibacterium]|uniref:WXG100 family type VII secretion target n=1 Tax=unclassified Mycolicibacterium TaxID=2636767 RepID=UPI002ED7984E